jgi:hypothetical protein
MRCAGLMLAAGYCKLFPKVLLLLSLSSPRS